MRQFVFAIVLMLIFYGGWQILKAPQKNQVKKLIKRHAIRFLIAVTALALVFAALVQNPSFQLF